MQKWLLISMILCKPALHAQSPGGSGLYNFLRLSDTPQLTGLGGVNVSQLSNYIGLSYHNPTLLRPGMHMQSHFVLIIFMRASGIIMV